RGRVRRPGDRGAGGPDGGVLRPRRGALGARQRGPTRSEHDRRDLPARHEEVEGTTGEAPEHIVLVQTEDDAERLEVADPDKVAFITQTTLSVDETMGIIRKLRERFPNMVGPRTDDICYATQNRQDAVKQLAPRCDLVLVI